MTEKIENDAAAVSRRNALKAGAALGVGAAAFAGPQIGILGAAPAYAAHCSPGKFTTEVSDDRNTDCGGSCAPYFRTHGEILEVVVNGSTITATIPDKVCTNVATIAVTGVPSGITCEVQMGIWENNVAGPFFTLPSTEFNRDDFSCNSRVVQRLICGPSSCFHS